MQAHCKDIKRRYPNAKTVFIGPCVAKKDEAGLLRGARGRRARRSNELTELARRRGHRAGAATSSRDGEQPGALLPDNCGGILKTMAQDDAGDILHGRSTARENCIAALKDIERGNIHNCFIEMSACVGSCVGGPVDGKIPSFPCAEIMRRWRDLPAKKDFEAGDRDSARTRARTFTAIRAEIATPNRRRNQLEYCVRWASCKPSDELNCGSCGYDTCREKAVAIYQGKAEISMCLPYLKDKAESFSDNIVNNTPNGLIVLNENLEVQQINKRGAQDDESQSALCDRYSGRAAGTHHEFLTPNRSRQATARGTTVSAIKRMYLAEYDKYIEQTIIFDRDYRILICIMRDVTDIEKEREKKENISRQTVEIADNVVDKQMRIVQEIASLLGETAAETKIALTKLKKSISDE